MSHMKLQSFSRTLRTSIAPSSQDMPVRNPNVLGPSFRLAMDTKPTSLAQDEFG